MGRLTRRCVSACNDHGSGTLCGDGRPGTYILILDLARTGRHRIGQLGRFLFPAGAYAYVGSAFGPGGLAARLSHHGRRSRHPHWHIDYLRCHCALRAVIFCHARERLEHQWAGILAANRACSMPAAGFGASDCRCRTHLFHVRTAATHEPVCNHILHCLGTANGMHLNCRCGARPLVDSQSP